MGPVLVSRFHGLGRYAKSFEPCLAEDLHLEEVPAVTMNRFKITEPGLAERLLCAFVVGERVKVYPLKDCFLKDGTQ